MKKKGLFFIYKDDDLNARSKAYHTTEHDFVLVCRSSGHGCIGFAVLRRHVRDALENIPNGTA